MSSAAPPAAAPRLVFAPGLRLARIAWRVLPTFGILAVGLLGVWIFGAGPAVFEQGLLVAAALMTWRVAAAVVREMLSPDRPWLRVIPISDLRAHRVDTALRAVLFFVTVTSVGIHLVGLNGWAQVWDELLRVLRNEVVIIAAFVLIGTSGLFKWLRGLEGDSLWAVLGRFAARVALPISFVALLVFAAAAGLGYLPLAGWVVRNAGWTILKVLAAVLVFRWLRRFLYRTVRFYAAEEAGADLDEAHPVGLGLVRLGNGIAKLVFTVLTFLWVLRSWSLTLADVAGALDYTIAGTQSLTWRHLVAGILRILATLWVGWLARTILIYFVFPRSPMGLGGRYAILAVLRYVVVTVAIVFALDALGVDMGSLSWFFGAAGIGLAFGLQDVIGNFVSGLIMLVERPIRVGDRVKIGTEFGTVENIRMRGTTLRTFDNTTLLIPNSQMLGERVTNLSHDLQHARIKIPLIAPHDADPRQIEALLISAAAANEEIVEDPAPFVWFEQFSPSSLDFTLVCYTSNVGGRLGVASRIRFAISDALREAGIRIPPPRADVQIQESAEHRLPPGGEADAG